MCALLCACNSHPLVELEATVSAANHEEKTLPSRTKLDFLFVVDDSSSMCQEQANLARNFRAISEFLLARLGSAADFRVAAVSTDLSPAGGRDGRFTTARGDTTRHCEGQVTEADPTYCAGLFGRPGALPIIRSGPDGNVGRLCADDPDPEKCVTSDLEQKFSCLVGLGAGGSSFEQGLEAMRTALACDGPNAGAFGTCCDGGVYDPWCTPPPGDEPTFLRPDAILVVVVLSDEDDCSHAPGDPVHSGDTTSCLWQRDKLLPVDDYVHFLRSLKRNPAEQLVVATIAAPRSYADDGRTLRYAQGRADAACDPNSSMYDATLSNEVCCPGGVCRGGARASCRSDDGVGYAGNRYLAFSEAFGDNGIGCPEGTEGTEACVHICEGSFSRALDITRERIQGVLGSYCLDRVPDCRVGDGPCTTDAERADARNYELLVRTSCPAIPDPAQPCTPRVHAAGGWSLDTDASDCPSGVRLALTELPSPGARVSIEYLVAP